MHGSPHLPSNHTFGTYLHSLAVRVQYRSPVLSLYCGNSWFFFQSFASDTLFLSLLLHSLRVNLDMGKIVYSWVIRRDSKIPGTVVRSSTIPEQLGRISYLLTDKTGICVENPALSRGMLLLLFGFWSVLLNPKLKVSIKTAFRVSFYSWMMVAYAYGQKRAINLPAAILTAYSWADLEDWAVVRSFVQHKILVLFQLFPEVVFVPAGPELCLQLFLALTFGWIISFLLVQGCAPQPPGRICPEISNTVTLSLSLCWEPGAVINPTSGPVSLVFGIQRGQEHALQNRDVGPRSMLVLLLLQELLRRMRWSSSDFIWAQWRTALTPWMKCRATYSVYIHR